MHRNVIRQLPRQRHLRAPPAIISSTRGVRSYSSGEASSADANATADTTSTIQNYSDEETKRILRALDQRALLDTKINLNALMTTYENLKTTLPSHFPSTIPAHRGPKADRKQRQEGSQVYTLAYQRARITELPHAIDALLARAKHMRSHIQDLQNHDYAAPGDGLAEWKEEIESMTTAEKREMLANLRYEEEAAYIRLITSAERNLERVKGLRAAAAAKREEDVGGRCASDGGKGVKREMRLKVGKRRIMGKREEDAESEAQEEGKVEERKKAAEKPAEKGLDLMELQRKLAGSMMGKP